MASKGTLVVGLGNPILGDDGIGWRVIAETAVRCPDPDIEFLRLSLGGLSLMERLIGFQRAILVDSAHLNRNPIGTVFTCPLSDLPDLSAGHTTAVHDTSLQTALKLGREMGASLPEQIDVVTIETAPVFDFSDTLSPRLEAAVPQAVTAVMALLKNGEKEE